MNPSAKATVDVQTSESTKGFGLNDLFRSNFLPALTGLLRTLSVDHPGLMELEVFSIVLDANKINAEIRWRLGRKDKPNALTGLFESIEARALIAYVPRYLEDEILEHAEEIALDTGKSHNDVLQEWHQIRPLLRVHDTAMQEVEVLELADAKDLVYIATQQQLGLQAIYSDDPHLKRMGASLVQGRIDEDLRDYARGHAVGVGVSIGSGVVIIVAVEAVPLIFQLAKSTAAWFVRQPLLVQLSIAAAVFVLVRDPKVRLALSRSWERHGLSIADLSTRLLTEYGESVATARAAGARIKAALPAATIKRTVLMYSRAACLVCDSPRSTIVIFQAMLAAGYRTTNRDPLGYIRRVLRESDHFVEVTPDHWIQLPPKERFDHSRAGSYRLRGSKRTQATPTLIRVAKKPS